MKKLIAILLAAIMLFSVLAACATDDTGTTAGTPTDTTTDTPADTSTADSDDSAPPSTDGRMHITYGTVFTMQLDDDELYQYISEKFNVEFEIIQFSWDNWWEMVPLLLTTDDVPDILLYDNPFGIWKLFEDSARSGVIRPLPDLAPYPNLASAVENGQALFEDAKVDGVAYTWPNWHDMMFSGTEGAFIRRDWLQDMGFDKPQVFTLTPSELEEILREFVKQDPGGLGDSGIPLMLEPTWGRNRLVRMFSPAYERVMQNTSGQYEWRAIPDMNATIQGIEFLQRLYQDGLIDKDYFLRTQDADFFSFFNTGQALMMLINTYPEQKRDVAQGLYMSGVEDPYGALGYVIFVNEDGVAPRYPSSGHWSMNVYGRRVDDDKLARIFDIMEWFESDEGIIYAGNGVEGIDWERDTDGSVVSLWEVDASGAPMKHYLSNLRNWQNIVRTPGDELLPYSTAIPDDAKEFYKAWATVGWDTQHIDFFPNRDLSKFDGPLYSRFNAMVTELNENITSWIVEGADIPVVYNEFIDSVEGQVQAVMDELNTGMN